jgi:AraC family transcriptional regulator of adaptative response/methylated-DNA-[protein]-cysteine methyltransferase
MTKSEEIYQRISDAIHYLVRNAEARPDLKTVAEQSRLSEFHFLRLFQQWCGVSPKTFVDAILAKNAKRLLAESRSLLDTSFEVGLSGAGRLHDLFIKLDGMTPGEYKDGGKNLVIRYGLHMTCFGRVLIGQTERGICLFQFVQQSSSEDIQKALREAYPLSRFVRDQELTHGSLVQIGLVQSNGVKGRRRDVRLFTVGTPFQFQVWNALLSIPEGSLVTYQDVAQRIRNPRAVRAVGTAVGQNMIAYLIPCHRVIRSTGVIHQYRWGREQKRILLGYEINRQELLKTSH